MERLSVRFEHVESYVPRPFAFLLIKPNGQDPNLLATIDDMLGQVGNITFRTEATSERMSEHYEHLHTKILDDGRRCLAPILQYYKGKKVYPTIIEAQHDIAHAEFIQQCRELAGKSNPMKTHKGQIRHLPLELGLPFMFPQAGIDSMTDQPFAYDNLIHVSDSPHTAIRETALWLGDTFPGIVEHYDRTYQLLQIEP